MKIVFDSLTGQGERFAKKLNHISELIPVYEYEDESGPIILVTRSENFGDVPLDVADFMKDNHEKVVGILSCGNRNWGTNFGRAGFRLEETYGIPVIQVFEMAGSTHDVSVANDWIENYIKSQ